MTKDFNLKMCVVHTSMSTDTLDKYIQDYDPYYRETTI